MTIKSAQVSSPDPPGTLGFGVWITDRNGVATREEILSAAIDRFYSKMSD